MMANKWVHDVACEHPPAEADSLVVVEADSLVLELLGLHDTCKMFRMRAAGAP